MAHQLHRIPPSLAWLTVFVPAMAYFIASRFTLTGELGTPVHSSWKTVTNAANDWVHLQLVPPSAVPMLVLSNLTDIVSTIWMHDAELGRGFLLLSSASKAGRVWRWERGGGPIPIGKTLFLEQSGCRSKPNCLVGSGAIAIDFKDKKTSWEGQLIVAEWGEQRVIRLEESGARTPLIMNVPSHMLCQDNTTKEEPIMNRIDKPTSMIMTPFGDLVLVDHSTKCGVSVIWRLVQATHIPPLQSTWESRMAHKWTKIQHNHHLEMILKKSDIGGIALDGTWETLFAVVKDDDDKIKFISVPLVLDKEEEETPQTTHVLMDLSEYATIPGPLIIDKSNHLYIGVNDGVLIVSPAPHKIMGHLELPERPVSLTIGQDSFFYIASTTNLYRIKIKQAPMSVPTNLMKTR